MSERPDDFILRDHTKLRDRDKRIYSVGDIPLPGVEIPMLTVTAVSLFLFGAPMFFIPTLFESMAWLTVPGLALAIALAIGTGVMWTRYRYDGMRAGEAIVVLLDWFVQPKKISGMTKDTEPEQVTWSVILWVPGQEWENAKAAHSAHLQANQAPALSDAS